MCYNIKKLGKIIQFRILYNLHLIQKRSYIFHSYILMILNFITIVYYLKYCCRYASLHTKSKFNDSRGRSACIIHAYYSRGRYKLEIQSLLCEARTDG